MLRGTDAHKELSDIYVR